MRLETGNVLAVKMNAHRHQWNGSICSQPQSWNCGADAAFRENFCATGVPRCFHLDVFKPNGPRFVTPDARVIQAVQEQPQLFDDQVLAFYGGRFGSHQGIASGDYDQALYGLYRVKHAKMDTARTPHRLLVEPHTDGWAMFPRVNLGPVTVRSVPGVAYLKQLRARTLLEAIEQSLDEIGSQKVDGWNADHEKHLRRAKEHWPKWLEKAEAAWAKLPPPRELPRVVFHSAGPAFESALAEKLKKIKISSASAVEDGPDSAATELPKESQLPDTTAGDFAPSAPTPMEAAQGAPIESAGTLVVESTPVVLSDEPVVARTEATTAPPQAFDDAASLSAGIPEAAASRIIEGCFDSALINALNVAFATKNLVILTGAPGAGKSWIASRLLDDADRERTVIVPVASTWRGREDLLGYVNPINGVFEPTEFTRFLCDAEEAWDRGDRRARLVIFEEFNLSQPEHWLSDLLVRLEYEPEQRADRTVVLGGSAIAGRAERPCSVVLVPSVRFAATLNNDHTVKPLSPRVLDRAALIEVSSSGRAALARAGMALAEATADLIDDLNDLLAPRGAAFSVRSARSLERAVAAGKLTGLESARALDLVLAQEVLSRVRLLAGDPRDEHLLKRLQDWAQKPECAGLTVCAARIADWAEALAGGRDVFQA